MGGSDQGSSRAILSPSSFCQELLPLAGRQCHAHGSLPRRRPLLSQCRPAITAPCPTSKVSSVSTFPKPLVAPPSFLEIQDESGVDRNLPHICPFGQWEMKGDPWVKLTKLRDRLEPGWGVKQGKGQETLPLGAYESTSRAGLVSQFPGSSPSIPWLKHHSTSENKQHCDQVSLARNKSKGATALC